ARELKRASPDVQLFLFGAHGLYLHPDYVPYLRGALVAASYSLSLTTRPETGPFGHDSGEAFQSTSAQGVFLATQALLSVTDPSKDLPSSGTAWVSSCGAPPSEGCMPIIPISINVIGEDGYWTLRSVSPGTSSPTYSLPALPNQTLIPAALLVVFVLVHLGV